MPAVRLALMYCGNVFTHGSGPSGASDGAGPFTGL